MSQRSGTDLSDHQARQPSEQFLLSVTAHSVAEVRAVTTPVGDTRDTFTAPPASAYLLFNIII